MPDMKSDERSNDMRGEGNKAFMDANMKAAHYCYSLAILQAASKECLALAYANRSAVYLELHKYDECLQNIQWARENNYPEDKIQKLNEREEKCKELKAAQVKDPEEDPWNFFKLSHPPNPKIPFIVDCLEMKVAEKYGRGIYATRDLSTGDILSIEDSFIHSGFDVQVETEEYLTYCATCDKTNMMNLIPCKETAGFMFCSEKCRDRGYHIVQRYDTKIYADIEEKFGGRENLLKFLESVPDITALNYSIFDFDWSNPNDPEYGINQIKCFLSFKDPLKETLKKSKDPVSVEITGGSKLIEDMVSHVHGVIKSFMKTRKRCWESNFDYLINHSCIPNVERIQLEGKVIYYVSRPIKTGEQLFRSYSFPDLLSEKAEIKKINYIEMPLKERKVYTHCLGFECDCRACKDDLNKNKCRTFDVKGLATNLFLNNVKAIDCFNTTNSLKPLIEQWKRNNEFITKYHKNLLSMDVYYVQVRNMKLLEPFAKTIMFPFRYKEKPTV